VRSPAFPQKKAETPITCIRAGKVYVGDGRILTGVRLFLKDGKIQKIEEDKGPIPKGTKVIDASRNTLMPGIVAAYSGLAVRDVEDNIRPDLVASDNFDSFADHAQLLAGGITSLYLSPGRSRLIPGLGSVVKLAGPGKEARNLANTAGLNINLNRSSRVPPSVFEPIAAPTADNPLRPARKQWGTSLSSQIEILEKAFNLAKDPSFRTAKEFGMKADLGPLRAVMQGTLPIHLHAETTREILQGLELATRLGASVVLDRPKEAAALKALLGKKAITTVLSLPLDPAHPQQGDYQIQEGKPRNSPSTPGLLAKAGVPIALVPSSDRDLDKLLMLAGLACRYGLPEHEAIKAITLEAARASGVADRVGSLEEGKDADLIILTGNPFDARTRILEVWVDGKNAYEKKSVRKVFALRCGRILLGDGTEQHNSLVVVQDGKILDFGPEALIPPGAKILEFPFGVLMPGMIAAATKLGLHQSSGSRIPASTSVDVAAALDPSDPAFREALEAGITTLFISPDDSGFISSRVPAVKTFVAQSEDKDSFFLREIAGIRMVVQRGGKAGTGQILAYLKKAKEYLYPKAKPKKASKPTKLPPTKKKDPISGTWKGTLKAGPMSSEITAEMTLSGSNVTASFQAKISGPRKVKVKGTWNPPQLIFKANIQGTSVQIVAEVQGSHMEGSVKGAPAPVPITFELDREGGDADNSSSSEAEESNKDKTNKSLEPFRAVFEKGAALIVSCSNRDAAQAAVDSILVQSKLHLVLQGAARQIAENPLKLPKGTRVTILLRPEELGYKEKGTYHSLGNALAQQGLDIALITRAQIGTKFLPVHAAWAVSQGLNPKMARKAITGAPAAGYGLDHRIGRIDRGCDADLVLLNGDPFDLRSRVMKVWVNGHLAINHQVKSSGRNANSENGALDSKGENK
jgi:imidazolonepropionase-like amidohydrolase